MEMLRGILSSFQPSQYQNNPIDLPSTASFPQFTELPIEIRLKIWKLALEPRIIPIHLHDYQQSYMNNTTCNQKRPCGCRYLPPSPSSRNNTVPPPAIFSVCRESRGASLRHYSTFFNKVYNIRGVPVPVPSISTADLAGFLNRIPYHPYETGLFMDLKVDIPMLKFDFSGYTAIKLHHFVKIAAKEARGIKTLVLSLHTASPLHEWLTRF
jgi:hypothetical protein